MDEKPDDLKLYLQEVRSLRQLLTKAEEKPLLESWAFWIWGVLLAAGTTLNPWLAAHFHWNMHESLLRLWLPIFLVGITIESIAFIVRFSKDRQPLFAQAFLKTIGGLFGFWLSGTIIFLIMLTPGNPLPALLLLFLSMAFFWLGSISISSFFINAIALAVAGIVFLSNQWTANWSLQLAGYLCAVAFIAAGFQNRVPSQAKAKTDGPGAETQ